MNNRIEGGTQSPQHMFANRIREVVLNSRRERGTPDEQRLTLYRAIKGRRLNIKDADIFEGGNPTTLKERGIFHSNGSVMQSDFRWGLLEPAFRSVPGLPVFANVDEALLWFRRAKFRGKPVIGILDLPLPVLSGEGREAILKRNPLALDLEDWEVPYETLVQHAQSGNAISGECYLQSADPSRYAIPDSIRRYEMLVEPGGLTQSGEIDYTSGVRVVGE